MGNRDVTPEARIAYVKRINADFFDPADFGEVNPMSADYGTPTYTPKAGEHPRLMFTAESLKTIKTNLNCFHVFLQFTFQDRFL